MDEGALHRGQVGVDVGVVVLHVADDGDVGHVVDELGPLVEESRVVLVALHHEVLSPTQPVAPLEVDRHAADEERRVPPRVVEDVREEARRRGLAVGARHHQAGPPAQELLGQQRGHARHALLAVEHRLHLGVAPGERVADHDQVGVRGDVGRAVGRPHRDPERLELGGHGGIDVLVRAGEVVALLAQQARQRRHGGAGDAREVDPHATAGSRSSKPACSAVQVRRARTPKGSVTLGPVLWPLDRPRATGTSSPSSASPMTSSSV